MKKTIASLSFALVTLSASAGVSVSIGEPGFYGRIDLGGYAAPQLIYPQPVYAYPAPYGAAPVYLYAPPGHIKHWGKYCHQYGACNAPVYFVQERWYSNVYAPRYRNEHGHYGPRYEAHYDGHHDDHDHDRHDRDDDHRGHKNGHGHGHDRD
jgi:hypothetical protein